MKLLVVWKLTKTLGVPFIWNCYQYCNFYVFWRGFWSGKSLSNIVHLRNLFKKNLQKDFYFLLFSIFLLDLDWNQQLTRFYFSVFLKTVHFLIVLGFSSCSLTYLWFSYLNKELLGLFSPLLFTGPSKIYLRTGLLCLCCFTLNVSRGK